MIPPLGRDVSDMVPQEPRCHECGKRRCGCFESEQRDKLRAEYNNLCGNSGDTSIKPDRARDYADWLEYELLSAKGIL